MDDTFVLLDYPLRLGERQRQHIDDLFRELMLIGISRTSNYKPHAPARLFDLVDMLIDRYADELDAATAQRATALAEGRDRVNLIYPRMPESRSVILAWEQVMTEMDAFCKAGVLLTLCTPPEIERLRRWTVNEVLTQLDGGAATPWPGSWD